MTTAWLITALLTWSAQVLVLVAAAALASLALAHPKARLILWQGLLAILLVLPAVERWSPAPVEVISFTLSAASPAAAPAPRNIPWPSSNWLLLIAAGAALRLLWIGVGFWRLRALRRRANPLPEPPVRFPSNAASWYVSERIAGPVTYGWLRPTILLPARFAELPRALRDGIACHELVHVRRRDWLFVVAEELIRSLLWFHPAVWFALARLQFAREEVVDREVIRLTQDRDGYLDALVTIAGRSPMPDLAPAPLFLKKRHLRARVAGLLKEITMSRSRIAASVAAVFSTAILALGAAVWLFPFVSPAQQVLSDPGLAIRPGAIPPQVEAAPTPVQAGKPPAPPPPKKQAPAAPPSSSDKGDVRPPTVLTRVQPEYPEEAKRDKIQGTVLLQVTVDETGKAANLEVLETPGAGLEQKAIDAVQQWTFRPATKDGQPVSADVKIEINFTLK